MAVEEGAAGWEAGADGVGGRVDDGGVVRYAVGHPEPLDVVRSDSHHPADAEPEQCEARLRAREVAQVEALADLRVGAPSQLGVHRAGELLRENIKQVLPLLRWV